MLEPATPAPLAAIAPRGYNSHVPAKDTHAMRLNVLFFGRLKDAIGHGEESIEIVSGSCIEDVFAEYVARHPKLAEAIRN